jgi:hypothetical protein
MKVCSSIASALLAGALLATGPASADVTSVKKEAAQKAREARGALLAGKEGKVILEALRKRNASYGAEKRADRTPPPAIAKLDQEWIVWQKLFRSWKEAKTAEPKTPPFITAVMQSPCSDALRNLMKQHKGVSELFIVDRMGANVCVAEPTSDYDQGDEPKWIEPFLKGQEPHVGEPARDKSSDKIQTQVSFPIVDDAQKVGVVTIGIASIAR